MAECAAQLAVAESQQDRVRVTDMRQKYQRTQVTLAARELEQVKEQNQDRTEPAFW